MSKFTGHAAHADLCRCYDCLSERHMFCSHSHVRLSRLAGEDFFGQHLLPPSFNMKGWPLCPRCAVADGTQKRHQRYGSFSVMAPEGWQEAIEQALDGKLREE